MLIILIDCLAVVKNSLIINELYIDKKHQEK